MSDNYIYSICVFGSTARERYDSLSDKDILIVTNDVNLRKAARTYWSAMGWSVASYTPNRIIAMASSGSLFIQHLKKEGAILCDESGWLRSTLSAACVKESYLPDLLTSKQMLAPLDVLEDRVDTFLLAADISYVFIRNAGIYLLADKGIYEFDYYKIIYALVYYNYISESEAQILCKLRYFKNIYRTRVNFYGPLPKIHFLQEICDKIVTSESASRYIHDINGVRLFECKYATVRDIEANLVKSFGLHHLDVCDDSDVSSVWKIVKNPRGYSWNVRNLDSAFLESVSSIISKKNTGAYFHSQRGREGYFEYNYSSKMECL